MALQNPENGNPGCGGTEYMSVAIPFFIRKNGQDTVEPILFTEYPGNLPSNISQIPSGDLKGALNKAIEANCSYFVYKPSQSNHEEIKMVIDTVSGTNIGVITWLQLTPTNNILMTIANHPAFKAVVCVEHEQFDSIRDHPVFRKALVIPNAISLVPYKKFGRLPIADRELQIVYLGSLVPQKGFSRLAKAWPQVIKSVPDASLMVIGSGKLYNERQSLGKWGVATEAFEKKWIRPYLSSKNGDPIPSVKFLGVLGEKKIEYLMNSRIGIVNPVGRTETFCISAIELQAAGTPAIGGAYGGLFDTIQNGKTGYLVKNNYALSSRIIQLLKNDQLAQIMSDNAVAFIERKYEISRVAQYWLELFSKLDIGDRELSNLKRKRISNFAKAFIYINSQFRGFLKLPIWWPSHLALENAFKKSKSSIKKRFTNLVSSSRNSSNGAID